jgi:hypothetical protein
MRELLAWTVDRTEKAEGKHTLHRRRLSILLTHDQLHHSAPSRPDSHIHIRSLRGRASSYAPCSASFLHSARCCSGSQVFVTRITTDESVSRSTYPPSSLCPGSRRVPTTPMRHDSAHMLRVISAAWTLRKHERKWAGTALFGLCDGAEEKAMRADAGRIRAYLIKSSLSQDDPQELMCTSTNGLAKFLSQEGSLH